MVLATLEDAVRSAVAAVGDHIEKKDRAGVELALRYARAIDEAGLEGGQTLTKALYLGPHLLNTLVELGLTPAKPVKAEHQGGPETAKVMDELGALRKRHRGGA